MAFDKGTSGNPGGRPKNKLFAEALRIQVLALSDASLKLSKGARRIDAIAQKLVMDAMIGDNTIQAAKEIRDTLDGKPAQAIEHSGNIGTTHEQRLAALENPPDEFEGEEPIQPVA